MTKTKRRFLHIAITVIFIAAGALGLSKLTASKAMLKKSKPPKLIPVVRTIKIKTGPQAIIVRGEGTVRPLQEINLTPQVGGIAIYISPDMVNGGVFRKGDVLLRIDPVDYQLAVTLAEAKVKESESRLTLAQEEAAAALEEWRLLHSDGPEETVKPPPLVAKEPQLAAAKARFEADQADLRKAFLNLERTELRAPFDGRVRNENIDAGQYVAPGKGLGTIYSIEAAEIVLPLKNEDLSWFHVPGFTSGEGPGSHAEVRARIAGEDLIWAGEVVRSEGELDERTRMINVVVKVEKPYDKKPPLALGLFVAVDIKGRTLPSVVIIPRAALREDNIVWVVDKDGLLHFKKVDVVRIQGERVSVSSGLKNGERVVISFLKVVTDGMSVRNVAVREDESP